MSLVSGFARKSQSAVPEYFQISRIFLSGIPSDAEILRQNAPVNLRVMFIESVAFIIPIVPLYNLETSKPVVSRWVTLVAGV